MITLYLVYMYVLCECKQACYVYINSEEAFIISVKLVALFLSHS